VGERLGAAGVSNYSRESHTPPPRRLSHPPRHAFSICESTSKGSAKKGKEMATKSGAKKGGSKKGPSAKSRQRKTGARAAAFAASRLADSVEESLQRAELTASQCVVWRQGEFRKRVREAVAAWAQEPPPSILPTNTLGELAKGTPWNTGQQSRLVQAVNIRAVFAPPFPETSMVPPSQLLPASTTVAQWERVVWRHQEPETPCFPFTD
jgi:hypothetical protein